MSDLIQPEWRIKRLEDENKRLGEQLQHLVGGLEKERAYRLEREQHVRRALAGYVVEWLTSGRDEDELVATLCVDHGLADPRQFAAQVEEAHIWPDEP